MSDVDDQTHASQSSTMGLPPADRETVTEWGYRIRWPRRDGGENEAIGTLGFNETRAREMLDYLRGKVPGSTTALIRRQVVHTIWVSAD